MQSLPSATYSELDQSTVPPAQLGGKHGLITPTLFGPTDKPYPITSVDGFNTTFGANGAGSPYYAQIKRALARGTAFYIQRLVASDAAAALIELATSGVTINAKYDGAYANGKLGVQYTPLSVGITFCKLEVIYTPNPTLNETFEAADYTALITLVNAQSALINITVASPTEPPTSVGATVFVAAGSDGTLTSANITTAVNTLLPNFNDITDMDTIGALGAYLPADAANVLAYVMARGDVFGLAELDPALSGTAAVTAAGALGLPAGSSYIAVYWGSLMYAWSPDDNATVGGPLLPDIMAVYSYSDAVARNKYRAPAGSTRGLIPNVTKFAYNLLSPANSTVANQLVAAGVNVVGQHPSFGPVVWGAGTMNQKNSALDAINVRRMLIWLRSQLQPIFDAELFDPMDPQSWLIAYNKCKPILNGLINDQALTKWVYTGDQFASTVAGATFNTQVNLANGLYKALINLVPIGYISSISFTAEVNNLLSLFNSAD